MNGAVILKADRFASAENVRSGHEGKSREWLRRKTPVLTWGSSIYVNVSTTPGELQVGEGPSMNYWLRLCNKDPAGNPTPRLVDIICTKPRTVSYRWPPPGAFSSTTRIRNRRIVLVTIAPGTNRAFDRAAVLRSTRRTGCRYTPAITASSQTSTCGFRCWHPVND
jgi:hypothetical protein